MIDTSGLPFPKPGIVRVKGKDMRLLRLRIFMRDGGVCSECGVRVILEAEDNNPRKADLSHIKTKRNNGDDPSNLKLSCHECHMRAHNGGKPVPPK